VDKINEKALREHCALAVVRRTQLGEDRCTQFPVIVVTDPQTHKHTHTNKQTHRQDRLQLIAPLSLARSVNICCTFLQDDPCQMLL